MKTYLVMHVKIFGMEMNRLESLVKKDQISGPFRKVFKMSSFLMTRIGSPDYISQTVFISQTVRIITHNV